MLCHRCNRAGLSFRTVTLRFPGTELICVTRSSVVYTASRSPPLLSVVYLSTRRYSPRANSRLYIRKKWRSDSTVSRRPLVNVENTLSKANKIFERFKRGEKAFSRRFLDNSRRYVFHFSLNKNVSGKGDFCVPGIIIREDYREAGCRYRDIFILRRSTSKNKITTERAINAL